MKTVHPYKLPGTHLKKSGNGTLSGKITYRNNSVSGFILRQAFKIRGLNLKLVVFFTFTFNFFLNNVVRPVISRFSFKCFVFKEEVNFDLMVIYFTTTNLPLPSKIRMTLD